MLDIAAILGKVKEKTQTKNIALSCCCHNLVVFVVVVDVVVIIVVVVVVVVVVAPTVTLNNLEEQDQYGITRVLRYLHTILI